MLFLHLRVLYLHMAIHNILKNTFVFNSGIKYFLKILDTLLISINLYTSSNVCSRYACAHKAYNVHVHVEAGVYCAHSKYCCPCIRNKF